MFGIISTPARLILPPIRIEMAALEEHTWLESESVNIAIPLP